MNRFNFCFIAALTAIVTTAVVHAAGPNLDVAGFKIGMNEDDAIPALKPHNARFYINQPTSTIEGISEPIKPSVTAIATGTAALDGENMSLVFTLPPGKKVLWGIQRAVSYAPDHRLSLDATLAALRQKYGPESVPPSPASPGVANLAWVFDAKGNLLPRDQAMGPYMRCTSILQNHLSNNDQSTFNDLQTGLRGAINEAVNHILITASVQYTVKPGAPSAVYNLTVTINDGRLYGPALLATRARVVEAVNARTAKESKTIDQRGGPSL